MGSGGKDAGGEKEPRLASTESSVTICETNSGFVPLFLFVTISSLGCRIRGLGAVLGLFAHYATLVRDLEKLMRTCLCELSVMLVLLGSVFVHAKDSSREVKMAVEHVLRVQQEAWNRHDLEGFMAGYWNSPDLTFFSGAQRTAGWQGAIDRYRKTYQSEGTEMGKLEFSGLQIEALAPDAAFVRGQWHLTMSDGKTPHGLFTLIFRKFPEGWKIVHDHTSAE